MSNRSIWIPGAIAFCLMLFLNCDAQTQKPVHIIGCAVGRSNMNLSALGTMRLTRTGDLVLNQHMNEDCIALRKVFDVGAAMILLDEAGDPNAYALDTVFPDVLKREELEPDKYQDGTVLIGLKLINDEFANSLYQGYAIPTIIGHEFAHIKQYKRKFPYMGKWKEIHADYMAGWFTAHRSRFRPQDTTQSFISLVNMATSAFSA